MDQVEASGCFYCCAERPDDDSKPPTPCASCAVKMSEGIILMSANDASEGDPSSLKRTGSACVITEGQVRALIKLPDVLAEVLRARVAFIPDYVWDAFEIPRGVTGWHR